MATPTYTFSFYTHDSPGGFGMTLEDISRPGIDGTRMRQIGIRGEQVTLSGSKFFNTRNEALMAVTSIEEKRGTGITLVGLEDSTAEAEIFNKHVLLINAMGYAPQAEWDSKRGSGFRITFSLTIQRYS